LGGKINYDEVDGDDAAAGFEECMKALFLYT
jgi:hypothetical protein